MTANLVSQGRVSWADLSHKALVSLSGREGLDFIQRLSTNDVSKLEVGAAMETLLTNEKGRVVDLVVVIRITGDTLLLAGETVGPHTLTEWLKRFIIMEDLQLANANDDYRRIAIWPSGKNDIENNNHSEYVGLAVSEYQITSYVLKSFLNYSFAELLVWRNQFATEKLSSTVSASSELSSDDFDSFRIATGAPGAPGEICGRYNPFELRLDRLVSFTKGCFIGQEVIARLDTYKKPQRRLTLIEFATEKELPHEATILTVTGSRVGMLTSVTRRNSTVRSLAMIGAEFAEDLDFFIEPTTGQRINGKRIT